MDYNIGAKKSRISVIRNIIKRWAIRAAVMLLIVIIAGVSIVHFFSYSKFSLTEGIAHFSFEYPSHYYLEYVRMEDYFWEETRIRLLTRNVDSSLVHNAEIIVDVEEAGHGFSNTEEAVEFTISWWTSRGYDDFQILKYTDVEIAGLKGEKLVYSFDSFHEEDIAAGTHTVRTPCISRRIYLNHDDKIWHIILIAHEDYAETAKDDFEHIIKTFKVLE